MLSGSYVVWVLCCPGILVFCRVVCLYFFYICLSFFMSCSSVVIGAAVFFVDVLLLPFNFWPVVRSDFCLDGLHRYLVNSGDCS